MVKTILVTGASGFIGAAFVKMFGSVAGRLGYQLMSLVRKPTGLPGELVLDFENSDFGYEIKKLRSVDTVLHLGAKVDFTLQHSELSNANVTATRILADWTGYTDTHFILASSISVYGVLATDIRLENTLKPDSYYAQSKLEAEQVVRQSVTNHLILRLAGVYGNNGKHLMLNETIAQAQQGIIPTVTGSGEWLRNYIYLVDLTHLLAFCIKTRKLGTHLVSGSELISIGDMAQGVCDTFIPGTKPHQLEAGRTKGHNQIVEHSAELPQYGRSFGDALKHMKYWWEKENE